MNTILFEAHSGWRYVVLLVSAVALIKFIYGWLAKSEWSKLDRQLIITYAAVLTIQWLLGIVLWIMRMMPMNMVYIEHLVTMTLALAPAHITLSRVNKASSSGAKYRTATIFTGISTLLVWIGVALITGVI
ncbi:MAG: hypothetical protein KDD92_04965 [Caldilineaceae bacterium]|nr:hypothetical protein [Caldilineaceae bacterium]